MQKAAYGSAINSAVHRGAGRGLPGRRAALQPRKKCTVQFTRARPRCGHRPGLPSERSLCPSQVAFPRFMLAMKLFAACAKIDADDIVLLYRQPGLTTVDEGLDLAEQAYPGRPVPARFDSCLPRLWTPAAVSLSREDQVAARSRWHLPGPSGRPLPKTWDAGADGPRPPRGGELGLRPRRHRTSRLSRTPPVQAVNEQDRHAP